MLIFFAFLMAHLLGLSYSHSFKKWWWWSSKDEKIRKSLFRLFENNTKLIEMKYFLIIISSFVLFINESWWKQIDFLLKDSSK